MARPNQHAFVDESKRRQEYSMVAILADGDKVASLRRQVRSLLLPGQSRIHMTKESAGRQLHIAKFIAEMDISVIFVRRGNFTKSERRVRDDCLADMTRELLAKGVLRLSLESCDQDVQDRSVIAKLLRDERSSIADGYDHYRASQEPLLWLPDAVAWAQGKGGKWSQAIAPLMQSARKLVA